MLDILKNILLSQEWVEDKNITNVQQINDSTYEFTISHEHIFIVCDEEGAECGHQSGRIGRLPDWSAQSDFLTNRRTIYVSGRITGQSGADLAG